jgi:hypothetical protein
MSSRAYCKWLNGESDDPERAQVQAALDQRFNSDAKVTEKVGHAAMVGHVDIVLVREPEGWRVVSAWASGGQRGVSAPPPPTDWRPQVIEALKEALIPLAHS